MTQPLHKKQLKVCGRYFISFFFALGFVINLNASISNHRVACFVVSLTVKHKF